MCFSTREVVVLAVYNGLFLLVCWLLTCFTIFLGLHNQVGSFVPLSLSMSVLLVSVLQCVPNSAHVTLLTASVSAPFSTGHCPALYQTE